MWWRVCVKGAVRWRRVCEGGRLCGGVIGASQGGMSNDVRRMRGGAALAGLLVLPLAVPVLIFGAGSLAAGGQSGLALAAAASLVLLAIAPFAGGAAIRGGR